MRLDEKVKCPICQKEVVLRGLGGHLFGKHQIRSSKEYQIQELKQLVNELTEENETLKTEKEELEKQVKALEDYKGKYLQLERELEKEKKEFTEKLLNLRCEICGRTLQDLKDEYLKVFKKMEFRFENNKLKVLCGECSFKKPFK